MCSTLNNFLGDRRVKDRNLNGKIHSSMHYQCQKRGYAVLVDVLIDMSVLQKKKYEDWRFERVAYLESVCTVNLHTLSAIMHQMRVYAKKTGLKPSFCYYKQWGTKKKGGQGNKQIISLQFSKSRNLDVEKWYATHFAKINTYWFFAKSMMKYIC